MTLVLSLLGAYLLALGTWIFYLAVMNLKRQRDKDRAAFDAMHWFVKWNSYAVLLAGLVMDAALHFLVGTLLFLDPPREMLLTARLKRYHKARYKGTWRGRLADWMCDHLLDPFDPSGDHC
jgi:hypothetical protein